MANLPETKKDALADRVAGDVKRELLKNYKDLRQHEVSKQDAREIIRRGAGRGTDQATYDTVVTSKD
jgi:hypothetical protein